MNIPKISVRNPVSTLMTFCVVLVIGAVALWQLPLDLMPKIEAPVISVVTFYQGAAPEDIETKVTDILERSLSTVPELKHISSKSKEDVSIVILSFEWGTDLDARANDVRDAISMASMYLPEDTEEPRVFKFDLSQMPVMVYGITAKESYLELEDILDDLLVRPLKRIPGVGAVEAHLPIQRQVNVDLDRQKLAAYGLTPLDVAMAIGIENTDTPVGNVKSGRLDYLIRVVGEYESIEALQHMAVSSRGGSVVRLSDVATVTDGFAELERHITVNGGPGGIFIVNKQSGANTVEVARNVRKKLVEIKRALPPDISMMSVFDSSQDIEWMVKDLASTLILGGVLTIAITWLFLKRWRASMIISLTIPFSLILGIIGVYFMGYTLNMMTLFALMIAIGMVVDNAIVVLESISRHREEGERHDEGAIYGASEVGMAVTASTLTTICVFAPLLFVRGIIRIIFSEFALTVTVVLLGSLFAALTMTPMLASQLMKKEDFEKKPERSDGWFEKLVAWYEKVLAWALSHRRTVILGSLGVFFLSLALIPMMGKEFMPEEDRAMVRGSVYLPVGTRVEETAKVMKEIDVMLREEVPDSERTGLFTRCGTSPEGAAGMFGNEGSHIGIFAVKLVPKGERKRTTAEISTTLRKRIDAQLGRFGIERFQLEMGDPMSSMMAGGELPLTMKIVGDDFDEMERVAAQIKVIAEKTPGAVDISISRVKGRPELKVNINRDKASTLGLNATSIGETMRSAYRGKIAGVFRSKGNEYEIMVRLQESDRNAASDLLSTDVRTPAMNLARVDNVASVTTEYGPVEIDRLDRGRIIRVMGNVDGRSLGEVMADIEKEVAKLDIPRGVLVSAGGQTEEQRDSFFWMNIALVVGILLVYMVMAAQFESLVHPFTVLFSIPFAFSGALIAVFLGGHNMSVVVLLGLLMLIGVVVNNAIVLVDYTNILRQRGHTILEAVQKAGRARLRPVLMTALTTIFGILPMAFGKGQGSESWNPLGLTVMGGLLLSTFVTLILVPTMYSVFERKSVAEQAAERTLP